MSIILLMESITYSILCCINIVTYVKRSFVWCAEKTFWLWSLCLYLMSVSLFRTKFWVIPCCSRTRGKLWSLRFLPGSGCRRIRHAVCPSGSSSLNAALFLWGLGFITSGAREVPEILFVSTSVSAGFVSHTLVCGNPEPHPYHRCCDDHLSRFIRRQKLLLLWMKAGQHLCSLILDFLTSPCPLLWAQRIPRLLSPFISAIFSEYSG